MNGYQQEGFGPMDRSTCNGIRNSTSVAYLRPVMRRPNLTVLTRAYARRLIQEGRHIRGLVFTHKRRSSKAFAKREVKATNIVVIQGHSKSPGGALPIRYSAPSPTPHKKPVTPIHPT